MAKRKKSSFDDGSEDGRKRRKVDLTEQLQELMDLLRNHKIEGGKILCETFIRAPKRRSLAEYYEVVSTPIDLLRIQQKIRMDEYDDLDQFNADIELLISNTKTYFKPDTTEYNDALKLWEVYLEMKNQVFGGGDSGESSKQDSADENSNLELNADSVSNSESELDDNPFEELFSAVMTATSDDGRQLSAMFELLPSKSAYPDYYEIVSEPIDLKQIASRIQNQEYNTMGELEKDLLLMVRNARMYNAPGSQIYKDANTLRKIITTKKSEIDIRKTQATKSSERIRAKRQNPFQPKWSAITASLKYGEGDEEESNFDENTNDDTLNFSDTEEIESELNPQWLLFNAIKDSPDTEPFLRLPSKRIYPDYYQEIKHPISLSQIATKIKGITTLVQDLTLVFDNAMEYNRHDSKIYRDAAKLKKFLQVKAREILRDADEEDEEEKRNDPKSNKRTMVNAMSKELKNVRRNQKANDSQLKKRLRILYQTLNDYEDPMGRYPIDPFIDKPSRKTYPDYYSIIENPIDMRTIDTNIKNDMYQSEESLVEDFRLMFNNCRLYNEDNSMIYQDAVRLEQVLNEKLKDLNSSGLPTFSKTKKDRQRPSSGLQFKIKTLYETVRDYTDKTGRLLSAIFQKLPSRAEFPDYYEVIRKPMCLEKIGSRIRNNVYDSMEELLSDIILMLDNACRYNEPDSQLFKDALTLQQVALQAKIELNEDGSMDGPPDIKVIIQDLLTNLFISIYNHQDEEGRCFSDSINELSEMTDKSNEAELKTINFDLIKRNLNQGRYRRLDRFQQDMFEVFERARKMSRTDSQAFEDSIELQTYFITLRNELCRNGEVLKSTALNYTLATFNAHIEILRHEKASKEIVEEEAARANEEKEAVTSLIAESNTMSSATVGDDEGAVVHQDLVLNVGDFVYVEPIDKNQERHIIYIEKFQQDQSGQTMVVGCWFYRPHETFHLTSRKFMEKEVFKSDNYTTTPLNQVMKKCCVMFVKDYFRSEPVGISAEDVFVCESRYSSKGKSFKKIKIWPCLQNLPYVSREAPLLMNRVPSVFKDQTEKLLSAEQEAETQLGILEPTESAKILDVPRPNVLCNPPEGVAPIESVTYYEQFTIPAGTFRVGDCCYVRTDQERNLICRIDRMWVDAEGNPFFHGPWFVQQAELPSTIGSFYPQEVFLSSIEDTNPLLSICERCTVLGFKEYTRQRPTEMLEKDVYVCEIRYLEHEKKFEQLPFGELKKFSHSNAAVVVDEVYFFRKPLSLAKASYALPQVIDEQSQLLAKLTAGSGDQILGAMDVDQDESNDVPMPAAQLMLPPVTPSVVDQPTPQTTPQTIKKKGPKRLVTGYIIFASEVRRSVVEANPECSFGDISRIIGTQWKVLTPEQKNEFEQRAAKQNQGVKEQAAAERALLESMPQSPAVNQVPEHHIYECHWENKCDFQFEDASDLLEHLTQEPNGHVWRSYADSKDKDPGEFQCMYHGCGRVRKGVPPFPSIQRLVRHCKEVHVNKQVPKYVDPEKRSKNYVPSSKNPQPAQIQNTVQCYGIPQQQLIQAGSQATTTIPIMTTGAQIGTPVQQTQYLQHQLMNTTIQGQSIQGVIHQPTVVSSVPQSIHLTQQPAQMQVQKISVGVQAKPAEPIFMTPPPRNNRLVHTHTYMKYIENLKQESHHINNWQKQLGATAANTVCNENNSRLTAGWFQQQQPSTDSQKSIVDSLWCLREYMLKDALNLSQIY